ncbi:MAG: hypothetical protein M3072_11460 [Candidatus Dormibacteraeota bacterium]|nr:hypothetical protein [Candidatus Dormibacteraeota bacterium]
MDVMAPKSLVELGLAGVGAVSILAIATLQSTLSSEVKAAVMGGSVAGIVSILLAVFGIVERQSTRREDHVVQALAYFGGHSQPRNIGISVIEGFCTLTPALQDLFIPLLVNQTMFLLAESGQHDAPHEVDNLERIVGLLIDAATPRQHFMPNYERLLKVMNERYQQTIAQRPAAAGGGDGSKHKGLEVDAATLQQWINEFGRKLAVPSGRLQ